MAYTLLLQLGAVICSQAVIAQDLIKIEEVDYDQPGLDTSEWIEIRNNQDTELFLQGVSVVLYDGALNGSCTEYCRVDLSPLGFLNAGQRIVLGAHPCAILPLCSSTDAIQNGSPDVIVVEWPGGDLADSVEYGSGLTHSTCSQVPDYFRVSDVDSDAVAGSLRRCYFNYWRFVPAATPCEANACTVTDVPDPPPSISWGFVKTLYRDATR